jgi:hypothetical protein
MFTQFSLPVVHPAFELLKRSARLLHLVAAVVILVNALYQWQQYGASRLLCITQLIVAADIFILVLAGGPLLYHSPRLNHIFRLIEALVILGIGLSLVGDGYWAVGWLHLLLSASFALLLYREWRAARSEAVNITQTGITLPNLLRDAEIGWDRIRQIVPYYQSIEIETLQQRKVEFTLRRNLKIEELEQINEFCQKHLRKG